MELEIPPETNRPIPDSAELEPVGRRVRISILLILALLLAGGSVGGLLLVMRVEPPRREIVTLPPLVESTVLQAQEVVERFVGYGTAQAIREVNIAAEVSGAVIERVNDIRAGSVVEKGQVLIRLDDRPYRYALERAEALAAAEQAALDELTVEERNLDQLIETAEHELRVAEEEKRRVTSLFERQLAAKKEYDLANLSYQRARRVLQGYQQEASKIVPRRARLLASRRAYEAEAALARLNRERCAIEAPFSGRIRSLYVDLGDRVGAGTVVLTLIDSSRVEIPIQLPASVYPRVGTGAACTVACESMAGMNWEGQVARVAPAADERTRTFSVYVIVDNGKQPVPLVPGLFVRAEVRGPVHPDGILVPRGACRNDHVFVVEDGIARRRSVTAERLIEDRALVRGELESGDRLILSHLDLLTDGTPVRIRADELMPKLSSHSGTSALESRP